MNNSSGNSDVQTYCLKPIIDAKDCKEYCHPNFRRPCLDRLNQYNNGILFNVLEINQENKTETNE